MFLTQGIGISAYGTALPKQAIRVTEIETAQGKTPGLIEPALGVKQKTVPGVDEDTITLATDAASQALSRWSGQKADLKSLFIGSESHPYAVKPSGTIVSRALNLGPELSLADLQFACKAGTQALQICSAYIAAGLMPAGLAIGADTAQSRPGDVLEFTAGAGAAAFVIGRDKLLAKITATISVATDTPDFWRRPGQLYPEHAGRFTGEPAYFAHVGLATQKLLAEVNLKPSDLDFCVFHTPNAKFPQAMAKQFGFSADQIEPALVVKKIGNTYAAASLLALAAVLDQAKANQKILVTSYGSGAGADSFLLETTSLLEKNRSGWTQLLAEKIEQLSFVTYQQYRSNTGHGE